MARRGPGKCVQSPGPNRPAIRLLLLRERDVPSSMRQSVMCTLVSVEEQPGSRFQRGQHECVVANDRGTVRRIPCDGYVPNAVVQNGCHGQAPKVGAAVVSGLAERGVRKQKRTDEQDELSSHRRPFPGCEKR